MERFGAINVHSAFGNIKNPGVQPHVAGTRLAQTQLEASLRSTDALARSLETELDLRGDLHARRPSEVVEALATDTLNLRVCKKSNISLSW